MAERLIAALVGLRGGLSQQKMAQSKGRLEPYAGVRRRSIPPTGGTPAGTHCLGKLQTSRAAGQRDGGVVRAARLPH